MSVLPVCSCHRRREGSKTAVLLDFMRMQLSGRLYNVPRQEKVCPEIQLFLNITEENGKIGPGSDHACTLWDTVNQL